MMEQIEQHEQKHPAIFATPWGLQDRAVMILMHHFEEHSCVGQPSGMVYSRLIRNERFVWDRETENHVVTSVLPLESINKRENGAGTDLDVR